MSTKKPSEAESKEIIETAMERFRLSQEAFSEFRKNAREDLKFCSDDQWEMLARQARESSGRPCVQIDHIGSTVRQVVNESRQNRPAIEIDPTGGGADIDTAAVFSGLIRHIEYDSSADTVYDTAEEYAVKAGLGFFRLIPDYEGEKSFDQKLLIKAVADPATVFMDPHHMEPDGSDQEWAFIIDDQAKEDFKREYPKSKMAKANHSSDGGWGDETMVAGWVSKDTVRVAEYFYRDYTAKTLYKLHNNITEQDTVELSTPQIEAGIKDGTLEVLAERETEVCNVKWCKITGNEILEMTDWPSMYIPLFPVKGEEFWVDGDRFMCGMVRRLRDPQRMLNYLRSAQIEAVDLAPKAPFIGAAGQFDTFEQDWRDANRKNLAYLEYNPKDVDGNPAAAPVRSSVEPAIQAIMATGSTAIDDIKAISGVYDDSLGKVGNAESGVAIKSRQQQTSNANFHFYDNLCRAVKHLGRVLVDVVPIFYDTERTIRIIKPNGDQEIKAINQISQNGKMLDFSIGKYDVVVKTGASYLTRREALVATGTSLMSAYPAAGPLIADLVVAAGDGEGAQEMAARLRTQVPPEVLAATGENDGGGGDPKQQIQGLTQQLQASQQKEQQQEQFGQELMKQLKDAHEEIKLMQLAQKTDHYKADLDYDIQAKKLALQEATTELEFLTEERKAKLEEEALEIQRQTLGMKAIGQMAQMNDVMHDKTIATIAAVKPLPEIAPKPDGHVSDAQIGGKLGREPGMSM